LQAAIAQLAIALSLELPPSLFLAVTFIPSDQRRRSREAIAPKVFAAESAPSSPGADFPRIAEHVEFRAEDNHGADDGAFEASVRRGSVCA
jgi:hypothetical protein